MLDRLVSATPWGVDARRVQVEADVYNGLPQMHIVGLGDASVRESRERVRSAIKNSGFDLPPRVAVVNLAPADLPKNAAHLDVAIAAGLLAALGQLPEDAFDGRLLVGELGLNGEIRPVRGALAIAELAGHLGMRELLLPAANAAEAVAADVSPVIPVRTLGELVDHVTGEKTIPPAVKRAPGVNVVDRPDLSEVRGQEAAKRAMEVAAAGGHNLLFVGPPGSGKTMLARRFPGILPPLDPEEAIAVTKIHSLVAVDPPSELLSERPFRCPHFGISAASMVGGGSIVRPGEASLAHAGVLFLDELPEYRRDTLEALHQPLEEGRVTILRRHRTVYPARFLLVLAMNPCPCGNRGNPRKPCQCPAELVERYRSRISAPLLDRIDIHVEVPAVSDRELRGQPGEPSAVVADRVTKAREVARRRYGGPTLNAGMSQAHLEEHCRFEHAAQRLLHQAFERRQLSARALSQIMRVGRTIADLDGADVLLPSHIAEAIQYRALGSRP